MRRVMQVLAGVVPLGAGHGVVSRHVRDASFSVGLAGLVVLAAPTWRHQDLTFPALAADAPAGSGTAVRCGAGAGVAPARCGRFRVWENRDARSGRVVDIAFVVLEATGSAQRVADAVVLLPGGPGETLTNGALDVARRLADLRRVRDIVLVDVRGVGQSAALDCVVPFPGGFRSRFGTVFPIDHARACRDSLRRRAHLAAYTTAASVDDIEELRTWLGHPQFNLVGGSYGTRVAQVYMRRHPAAVRTVVLNGVAPVDEPLYVQHARLLQRALERVITGCVAEVACGTRHPELAKDLERVLDRFHRDPPELDLQGTRVRFTMGDLSYALRGLLYGRAADVPGLISRAAAGDVRPLAEYYVERTAWIAETGGSAGYHFSVVCAEDIAPLTDDAVTRETAGTFMGAHLIESYRAVCNAWPYARLPASHWRPVASDAPTLLLSGARDPVTPPEGGDAVARHLSRALHVVVPEGGHGVGGPCIRRMIAELINNASLDGIDTSCVPGAEVRRRGVGEASPE